MEAQLATVIQRVLCSEQRARDAEARVIVLEARVLATENRAIAAMDRADTAEGRIAKAEETLSGIDGLADLTYHLGHQIDSNGNIRVEEVRCQLTGEPRRTSLGKTISNYMVDVDNLIAAYWDTESDEPESDDDTDGNEATDDADNQMPVVA